MVREVRWFTPADLDAAWAAAEARHAAARAIDEQTGRQAINKFRDDWVRMHFESFLGEWAVADSIGVDRQADVSGRADDGTDLRAPNGVPLAIRFNPRNNGRLLCPANRPFKAHTAVLVVGTGQEHVVEIAGAVKVATFYEIATLEDFKVPTHWVDQDALTEWSKVRAWLRSRIPVGG